MTQGRHLLDLDSANRTFVESLVARARDFKRGVPGANALLAGRSVVGMFFENSTRTAVSFATAAQRLGAYWQQFEPRHSSLEKGESLEDTMKTLRATGVDALVIRHFEPGFPQAAAQHFAGSILNAGDGAHAHPTQGLLDAMTLVEEFGDLQGRQLVIAGDIKHSRVARSAAKAAYLLGMQVTLCGPPSLLPPREPAWGFAATRTDLDGCLDSADAVMLLRIQRERADGAELPPFEDLAAGYGLSEARAASLPRHCIIMHPGPVNRGVEIARSLVTAANSRIERQVENGVYARMAVLEWALA